MAGVNKVILIGNLGADPEVRNLQTGSSVANFNIATSESYTNKNGEKVTQTEWHRIECWEGLARVAEQYLKKGNSVYIEGKLRTEEYQDKDGINRYTTKVRAQNLVMLGGNNNQGQGQQNNQQQAAPAPQQRQQTPQQNGYAQPQNNAYQQAPTQHPVAKAQAAQNGYAQQPPAPQQNGYVQPQNNGYQQAGPQNMNTMTQSPNSYNNADDDLPF